MYLIAGLGNPEKKYENTRHNIGFEAVMEFCEKNRIELNKSKFKAIYGEGKIDGERVIVAMPQTYMNLSGESVGAISKFYKINNENIIILHDDISLPVGKIRIRAKGSAGGHNGLKSIISHTGSDSFNRIKIGVGAPGNSEYDLADYVLGKFLPEEKKELSPVIDKVCEAVKSIIVNGAQKAMNEFN